jgi:hypothetical protein
LIAARAANGCCVRSCTRRACRRRAGCTTAIVLRARRP